MPCSLVSCLSALRNGLLPPSLGAGGSNRLLLIGFIWLTIRPIDEPFVNTILDLEVL